MAKKSETLKQREKAQKDLLELKKMQQGLMETPQKEERDVTPKTFKEKKENFFYHYKLLFCGAIAFLAVLAFIVVNMVTKITYDSTPVLFTYEYYSSQHIEEIKNALSKFCEDIDGDNEINISVLDCSFNPATAGYEYQKNQRSKVQARIASGSSMLFLLDENTLRDLQKNLDYELFTEENIVDITSLLKEGFTKLEAEGNTSPQSELFLCLRKIEGSTAEGKKDDYNQAKDLLERVKNEIK